LMELVLIVMTVFFHLRTSWFYNVRISERY